MSSAERDRDRDRNTQEGETVPRSGVAVRLSPAPAGKLRSELGASFPAAAKRGQSPREVEKGQNTGRLRPVSRRLNRNGGGSNHADSAYVREGCNSRNRVRQENGRSPRRSGSRNRQRWSASPAYRRGESPLSDASGQQHAIGLRSEIVLFTRPTRHDVATRLLNRNTNRARNVNVQQPVAKVETGRLANRNRKRKRLFSESVLPRTDNSNSSNGDELARSEPRKKSGRFNKRRRLALRKRGGEGRYRSQLGQGNVTALFTSHFGSGSSSSAWRSPADAATLLERPRISPPANSNEYLINEHNQIDGVSPIVYKATSAHSTSTTPFGGTYTFPYTTSYRPDYTEEPSIVAAANFETASKRDDEAEVSTSSPNGHAPEEVSKHDQSQSVASNAAEAEINRQHAAAHTVPRRRAQTNSFAPHAQYDAEFSELYVNTLLDRFQQMNKQELVTQCLSLSGEVEQLEARLRDLKKQNDRLARTGTNVHATLPVSSSSTLQVTVPSDTHVAPLQSQCSVSSSNVQSDAHTEESTATRTEENEAEGHNEHNSEARAGATLSEQVDTCN